MEAYEDKYNDQAGRLTTRSLEEITNEAVIIYRRMEDDFDKLGKLLLEAKRLVPFGQFGKYLADNFPAISERQLQKYMQKVKENRTLEEVNRGPLGIVSLNSASEAHLRKAPQRASEIEQEIIKAAREKMKQWDQRGPVIIMHVKQFLTTEEPVGRDIIEAINNIDKFDLQEDIDQLKRMKSCCEQLSVRASELAHQLQLAIQRKERII